jgi:hypothetical protein
MTTCPVKHNEDFFSKLEYYYKEGLIKVKKNALDVWTSEQGYEHQLREIKILIPIGLAFNLAEVEEFVQKNENQWIILDYIVKKNRKYWENIEFQTKMEYNYIVIEIKYEEVFNPYDI